MTTKSTMYKIKKYKLIGCTELTEFISAYLPTRKDQYSPNFAHVIPNHEDNTLVMQSAFWTCKDYMVDCYNNDRCDSVKYTQGVDGPIYDKEVRTLLLLNHTDHVDNLLHNIQHLHHYEKQAHFKRTEVHDTEHPQVKYIQASGMWMKNSFMLSTFLSLIRLCVTPKKDVPDFVSMYTTPDISVNEANWYRYTVETVKPIYNKNFQLVLDNLRKFSIKSTTISPAGTTNRTNPHGIVGLNSFLTTYGLYNVRQDSIHKKLATVLEKIGGERYTKTPPKKQGW